MDIMARFHYFDRWTEDQRRECFERAKVLEFEPDQTIFVDGRSPVNYAHFVLSGRCMVLQCLKLIKISTKHGTYSYQLAEAQPIEDELSQFHRRRSSRMAELEQSTLVVDGNLTFPGSKTLTAENCLPVGQPPKWHLRPVNYEYHFIDIATYACGSIFGVGEHMEDRTVVARDRVQCLVIPRYWLLQKPQNVDNVWSRIQIFLEQRQPSRNKLFDWFLKELRWRKYRRQLRDDFVLVHVATNPTGIVDVPSLCRIEQSDVFA